jgi:hypothetical protein
MTLATILLTSALMTGLGACPETDDSQPDGPECACSGDGCPPQLCNIALELPASCASQLASATVLLDGQPIGQAVPGEVFESCEQSLGTGESAEVSLQTSGSAPEIAPQPAPVVCDMGGVSAQAAYCTLRFGLGDSCAGQVESAVVVVDGNEVGETRVDEPFVPCFLVPVGNEVTGAIRAGTELVLTAPLRCSAIGAQASLIMECP